MDKVPLGVSWDSHKVGCLYRRQHRGQPKEAIRMVAGPRPPQLAFGAGQNGPCFKGGLRPLAQPQTGCGLVHPRADGLWSGPWPMPATSVPGRPVYGRIMHGAVQGRVWRCMDAHAPRAAHFGLLWHNPAPAPSDHTLFVSFSIWSCCSWAARRVYLGVGFGKKKNKQWLT